MTTKRPAFSVGDRVYARSPINECWNPDYTATVIGATGNMVSVKWDHGPTNRGEHASSFALREEVAAAADVDRVALAISKAQDADYFWDEIAEWENSEEWKRQAYPDEYPSSAYEDREHYRKSARAALEAARSAV